MIGDREEIERLKVEIASRHRQSMPKKKNRTIQINTVLNDDNSSASSVYDFLNKSLGEDWWEWEFETLEQMLWIKYGVALENINRDKVWAVRHVCRSDGSFFDWYEFNQSALSFAGSMADFEYLRSPSPGMAISAVKELNHIRPDRKSFFSNDVIKYICIILKNDGIYIPPPSIINLVQKEMESTTSKEVRGNWASIFRRYKQLINGAKNIEENLTDIQAKRLFKAESAASEYSK
jgi:hypothetical protein